MLSFRLVAKGQRQFSGERSVFSESDAGTTGRPQAEMKWIFVQMPQLWQKLTKVETKCQA